jgi:hypothetical protein
MIVLRLIFAFISAAHEVGMKMAQGSIQPCWQELNDESNVWTRHSRAVQFTHGLSTASPDSRAGDGTRKFGFNLYGFTGESLGGSPCGAATVHQRWHAASRGWMGDCVGF